MPISTVYCPRCDRPKNGATRKEALESLADHIDKAHPDMDNNIRADLEDDKERLEHPERF